MKVDPLRVVCVDVVEDRLICVYSGIVHVCSEVIAHESLQDSSG